MAWVPDGEKFLKVRLFVLTESTNVTKHRQTDARRTDTAWQHRSRLHSIARQKRRSVCAWCTAFWLYFVYLARSLTTGISIGSVCLCVCLRNCSFCARFSFSAYTSLLIWFTGSVPHRPQTISATINNHIGHKKNVLLFSINIQKLSIWDPKRRMQSRLT